MSDVQRKESWMRKLGKSKWFGGVALGFFLCAMLYNMILSGIQHEWRLLFWQGIALSWALFCQATIHLADKGREILEELFEDYKQALEALKVAYGKIEKLETECKAEFARAEHWKSQVPASERPAAAAAHGKGTGDIQG